MLCVQGDCSVLEKKVTHCQLKRLKLYGNSTVLLPVLTGVKSNCSITDLDVEGEPITTCMPLTILYHIGVCTCMGWAHTCTYIGSTAPPLATLTPALLNAEYGITK